MAQLIALAAFAGAPRPVLGQPAAVAAKLPTTPRASVPLASPAAHPPLVAHGLVYVALQSGIVEARRLADATLAWQAPLAASRPLGSHDGLLIVAADDALHALGALDGKPRWRLPTGALHAPFTSQDGWVIASAAQELIGIRAADGSEAWRRPGAPLAERPTIAGDRLYLPLADGHVRAVDVATGEPRWARRVGGAPSEILADGNRLYVGSADRHFYCLDALSGKILWRFRIGALVRGRPAVEGAHVFVASLDNLVRAFDRGDGERKWNKGVAYRPMSGPQQAGGLLLVPGAVRELPVFRAADGSSPEKLTLPAPLATPPGVGDEPGGVRVMAAVLGSISSGWSLALFDSSFSLGLVPLTALPGVAVPVPEPPK